MRTTLMERELFVEGYSTLYYNHYKHVNSLYCYIYITRSLLTVYDMVDSSNLTLYVISITYSYTVRIERVIYMLLYSYTHYCEH